MGLFQKFEPGAQCIKVDAPIDAVVDVQLVDVEVGESHAQGVVGEDSHEDPVQDLGNVLHAQRWDPHDEHCQHGEQACNPAWHRHHYSSQFIPTHPHQHSMANTVSELSLSTLTHTNTAWPTQSGTQFVHTHPHQHDTAHTQSVNSVHSHSPTPTHLHKVWQIAMGKEGID